MHPATGLTVATSAVATAHLAISLLELTGRAVYTVRPAPDNVIALAADKPWWLWLHLSAGLLLATALTAKRWRTAAGYWSVAVMATWSALLLFWGLGALKPVSLLGPVLGLLFALAAIGTTTAWADREARARRRAATRRG